MTIRLEPGYLFGGPVEALVDPRFLRNRESSPVEPTRDEPNGSDRYWMKEALRESLRGIGLTNPNPAVGCVIVKDGREIARGHTGPYRREHAERAAFARLADAAAVEGATAYVTLEPCSHHGNQPPCAELLCGSSLRRVVVGRSDPNPLVAGRGLRRLREAGKEVRVGVLADEITAWNFPFFAQHTLNRPVVALKWAQTLDGQLADDSDRSQWISGPISRSYTHWLRQRYDAILVGARTFLADRPRLDARDCAQPIQHQPLRIVVDPTGRHAGRIIEEEQMRRRDDEADGASRASDLLLLTPGGAAGRGLDRFEALEAGFYVQPWNGDFAELPGCLAARELAEARGRPFQSVMVEGGAATLGLFLRAGLADVIHAFVSPTLTGGERHRVRAERLLESAEGYVLAAQARLGNDAVMELLPLKLAERIADRTVEGADA